MNTIWRTGAALLAAAVIPAVAACSSGPATRADSSGTGAEDRPVARAETGPGSFEFDRRDLARPEPATRRAQAPQAAPRAPVRAPVRAAAETRAPTAPAAASDPSPDATPAENARGPAGGVARLWAWYNPGTTSSDVDNNRGIHPRTKDLLLGRGWQAWIDGEPKALGYPPVVLRAPFGTSRWVNWKGEETREFRFEDTLDVMDDPKWQALAADRTFVEPWARYPAPVMFHIGTADDRELTDAEMVRGVSPFVKVAERRRELGNAEPVYVCLDHSMYFDDRGEMQWDHVPPAIARQSALVTRMLTERGIGVLTEAVPRAGWASARFWKRHGVAFRPHLAERPGIADVRDFRGLVLTWLVPLDFRWRNNGDEPPEPFAVRRARVLRHAAIYGNVAVPVFVVGGRDEFVKLERQVAAMNRDLAATR